MSWKKTALKTAKSFTYYALSAALVGFAGSEFKDSVGHLFAAAPWGQLVATAVVGAICHGLDNLRKHIGAPQG